MNASLLLMNVFRWAASTSNIPAGAGHPASSHDPKCNLARHLLIRATSRCVIVMDDIGKDCPLASLANKTIKAGQEIASLSHTCFG